MEKPSSLPPKQKEEKKRKENKQNKTTTTNIFLVRSFVVGMKLKYVG